MCILARELANQPTKGGKMIRINNIKANLDVDAAGLKEIVSMKTGLEPERIKSLKIAKKSVDARNKSNVQFVYALDMEVFGDEDYIASILAWKDIVQIKETASLSFAPKTFAGGLRPVVGRNRVRQECLPVWRWQKQGCGRFCWSGAKQCPSVGKTLSFFGRPGI